MRLNEQQAAFAGAVWRDDAAPDIGLKQPGRFAIYRNNVFAGLAGVLAARYPVVQRLLGDECFRGCCLRFVSDEPPRSPVLGDYGTDFADFLTALSDLASLPYLADVARLEWACHATLNGDDAIVLTPEALSDIEPGRVADLVLQRHPTACVLRSNYPVHSIWHTNMFDAATRTITADAAGEAVLVSRVDDQVSVMLLAPAAAAFTDVLFSGAPLADAAVAAAEIDPAFALAPTLAALLRANAFTAHIFNA